MPFAIPQIADYCILDCFLEWLSCMHTDDTFWFISLCGFVYIVDAEWAASYAKYVVELHCKHIKYMKIQLYF